MAFEENVFINCAFDQDFYPLLRPLLFAIIYLGLQPRIALEDVDSGRPRIDKIVELIAVSKYAIHDLSRIEANKAGELFRLNMPFEWALMSVAAYSDASRKPARSASFWKQSRIATSLHFLIFRDQIFHVMAVSLVEL